MRSVPVAVLLVAGACSPAIIYRPPPDVENAERPIDCEGGPELPLRGRVDAACGDGRLGDACAAACVGGYLPSADDIVCTLAGWSELRCIDPLDLDEDGLRRFPWGPDLDDDDDGYVQLVMGGRDALDADAERVEALEVNRFSEGEAYELGVRSGPSGIVTADFDGDGVNDLATRNAWNDTVTVLLGRGDGTFEPQPALSVGDLLGGGGIAAGDFDGDRDVDLVAARGHLFLNDGQAGFTAGPSVDLGGAFEVDVFDADLDGNLDLIGARPREAIVVALGRGDGTFRTPIESPSRDLVEVAYGYLDEDDLVDAVVSTFDRIRMYSGLGDGQFVLFQERLSEYIGPLAIGDVNGDGLGDIAAGHPLGTQIDIWRNLGPDFAFLGSSIDVEKGNLSDLWLIDVTADGNQDLVMVSELDGFGWARGRGNGGFDGFRYQDLYLREHQLIPGFFDGDLRLDFAVASVVGNNLHDDQLTILLGN